MKKSITIIALLFLYSFSSNAEIESIINLCSDSKFLSCLNISKKECTESMNKSQSYCLKKYPFVTDFSDSESLKKAGEQAGTNAKCVGNSLMAYFDADINKFNECLSASNYIKRINESINKIKNAN